MRESAKPEHDLPRIDSYRRDLRPAGFQIWLAYQACDAIGTRPIYIAVAVRNGA